jgi:hypothetical protein
LEFWECKKIVAIAIPIVKGFVKAVGVLVFVALAALIWKPLRPKV